MTTDMRDAVLDFAKDLRQALAEVIYEQEMIITDLEERVKRLEDEAIAVGDDLR